MRDATKIKQGPGDAWEEYQDKKDYAEMLREKAYSAGGIRYDKERVQSSGPKDPLCDTVIRIIEAEEKAERARNKYWRRYKEFALALQLAGFPGDQEFLWKRFWGGEHTSYGKVAKLAGTTKSRAQYLLSHDKFDAQFRDGVNKYHNLGGVR